MKEPWRDGALYKEGKVELVPVDWLMQYVGEVPPQTDLLDGTMVGMDALWQNLLEEGMQNPLVIRVGMRNKKVRLETGNHRLVVMREHGVREVPATVEVCEECGPDAPNPRNKGRHNFDWGDAVREFPETEGYVPPSRVFKELNPKV